MQQLFVLGVIVLAALIVDNSIKLGKLDKKIDKLKSTPPEKKALKTGEPDPEEPEMEQDSEESEVEDPLSMVIPARMYEKLHTAQLKPIIEEKAQDLRSDVVNSRTLPKLKWTLYRCYNFLYEYRSYVKFVEEEWFFNEILKIDFNSLPVFAPPSFKPPFKKDSIISYDRLHFLEKFTNEAGEMDSIKMISWHK